MAAHRVSAGWVAEILTGVPVSEVEEALDTPGST